MRDKRAADKQEATLLKVDSSGERKGSFQSQIPVPLCKFLLTVLYGHERRMNQPHMKKSQWCLRGRVAWLRLPGDLRSGPTQPLICCETAEKSLAFSVG